MKQYLGVDLHRTQFTVCTRLENGRTYLRGWLVGELKLFAAQLRKEDFVAVESTGNTRLFYDAVVEHVSHVAVVNPRQFKVISQSVKKTDKNDAELLALYLAKGLLPEVRMKSREPREVNHLAQTRDLLVKQRSALKAKLNNMLSAEGINLKRESLSSNKALERVLALPLSRITLAEARILVGQVRSLNQSIGELEELIEEEGPKLAGHQNLMSIKGIGPVSAAVLLSVIGDIRDFDDPGKLAAYIGLVPRVQNSNETEHSGRITKQGQQTRAHLLGAVRAHRQTIQLFPPELLSTNPTPARRRQSQYRPSAQIPGSHLPHPQKQLGVRRLPQLRPGLLKTGQTTTE
jgi:transposase